MKNMDSMNILKTIKGINTRSFQRTIRAVVLTMMLLGMGVLTSPAFAQGGETTPAASTEPAGIGILILLLGIVAILFVGGFYMTQSRPKSAAAGAGDEDEDDE